MSNIKYFSVTKFVNALNDKENFIKKEYDIIDPIISVYFEGKEAFKNDFGIAIKPLFIHIKNGSKPIGINYDKIPEIFECHPLVSFKENFNRKLPADNEKQNMFILDIYLNQKEYKGIKYYPTHMDQCYSPTNVEKIRNYVYEYQQRQINEEIPL